MSTLVTGVTSGLGRFLLAAVPGAEGWSRGGALPDRHFDAIVHCAHDREDPHANLDLLQRLLAVPCDRFVYVSSVDVHRAYSLDNRGYGLSKLRCEQFVRSSFPSHLILRPGAMLGRDARPNTLTRLLRGEKLRVTPDSTFGFVRHASLLPAVLSGTGTVTVAGNAMTVKDIAAELGLCPEYGEFPYRTPPVKPTHDTITEIKEFIAHDLAPDQG